MVKRTHKIGKSYRSSGSEAVDAARRRQEARDARRIETETASAENAYAAALAASAQRVKGITALGGDGHVRAAEVRAMSARERQQLLNRWAHKAEGTPETFERIAATSDRQRQSPLARMVAAGRISLEEKLAADEIAEVHAMIGRAVGVGSSSIEARVDCQNANRDALIESLARIRAEVTYGAWRDAIPEPKPMILDMIVTDRSFVVLARHYGLHWRTARKRLLTALRLWPTMKIASRHAVDEEAVFGIYARLGEGLLQAPRPKAAQPTIAEDRAA